uniref:Translation initiation factor IF-2, chloroplastic n=1 Tax=Mastocarpus papillatus TaxID=31436 RepID=A0A342RZL1_9FLOR|nr:translation initiation factor IF-2 [Mastocarpus papillatus]AOL58157.1 translation initiation factor IF-2 [Mastocarpus papillatus]
MTNDFRSIYQLFKINNKPCCFIQCVLLDQQEPIFVLKNPKLVYVLNKVNKTLKKNFTIDSSLQPINEQEKNSVVNLTSKFDKKNKNFSRIENDVEDRKNKTRHKKKVRNKIFVVNDEILIEDNDLINNSYQDSGNISLLRPSKPQKEKRKYKSKQNISVDPKSNTKSLEQVNVNNNKELEKKEILLDGPLTIGELATKLQIPETAIITWLFLKGISVTINQFVDISIACEVASHYNFTVFDSSSHQVDTVPSNYYASSYIRSGTKRNPIIAVFGHVDHGKTTLLDFIRKTNMVQVEAGGITQLIRVHEVEYEYLSSTEKLLFLDTPGHEAFTDMRLRGAQVADIVILLVAADDGLKTQTIETINYITNRQIPYVVAINKIDKQNIDLNKIKEQLATYNIVDSQWGGNSTIIEISALTGKNIDLLLSEICKLSEKLALKADNNTLAEGTILEAYLNKKTGPIANLVIQNGKLKVGDIIVSGSIYGKIKVITNSFGKRVNNVQASSIVNVMGFSFIPQAGLPFQVVQDEKNARELIKANAKISNVYSISKALNTRITLGNSNNKSNLKQINLILKTDTQGSIEAIINSFSQMPQEKVQINILSATLGPISDKDINLAATSQSIILGFNIQASSNSYKMAEKLGIIIKYFDVIYTLLDYIKKYMLSLVDPEYDKLEIGKAIVQTVFYINKGTVAGCLVNFGKLKKNAHIMIYRNKDLVYSGLINSLRHMKDNVNEVIEGNECGVMCENYNEWVKSDIIKVYELIQIEKLL